MERIEEHLKEIKKEIEYAEKKHPHFADELADKRMSVEKLSKKLEETKRLNDMLERYSQPIFALDIITEEVFEAIEAYLQDDLEKCYKELAQAGNTIVRSMELVKCLTSRHN